MNNCLISDQQFRKYGNPPYNVVLVHGGPGAVGEMAEVAKELSNEFGVIETFHRTESIHGQINELNTAIESETKQPVYLIGFSWGAWLSILYTADHQTTVKKLILIGCGPLEAKYAAAIYKTRLSRLDASERVRFKSMLNSLERQVVKNLSVLFNELSQFILRTDCYNPVKNSNEDEDILPEVFISIWKEAEVLRENGTLLNTLNKIKIPIHVIHGDYDPHPVEGVIKPLQKLKGDFEHTILKYCGHKPWIESKARSRFYDLLSKYLST